MCPASTSGVPIVPLLPKAPEYVPVCSNVPRTPRAVIRESPLLAALPAIPRQSPVGHWSGIGARGAFAPREQCKPIVSAHKIDTLACRVKQHDLYPAGGTRLAFWSPPVVLCQLTGPMHIGSRQPMSIALSKARNPAIFQFKLDQVRKRPSISNRQCQPDCAAGPASSRRRGD